MAETWAFVDGIKTVNGRRIPLVKSKTYISSNGSTIYTRCWWADNTQSCNCPGWTQAAAKKVKAGQLDDRECGHTKGKKEKFAIENSAARFTGVPALTPGFKVETNNRIIGSEE